MKISIELLSFAYCDRVKLVKYISIEKSSLEDGLSTFLLGTIVQGVFFNWPPPLDWPPQKCFDWPPLNFLSVGITFTSPDT